MVPWSCSNPPGEWNGLALGHGKLSSPQPGNGDWLGQQGHKYSTSQRQRGHTHTHTDKGVLIKVLVWEGEKILFRKEEKYEIL